MKHLSIPGGTTQVVMPLFNFQYLGQQDFAFSDGRSFIRHFEPSERLINRDIFSRRDQDQMKQHARKALVVEVSHVSEYKTDVNLLLMAFRILANHRTPIIKYRLSENDDFVGRIDETEMHVLLPGYKYEVYTIASFKRIDAAYMIFLQAERTAVRLKNAFYFFYRAFYSYHWVDAYLFYMSALEALFSLDSKGPATDTICQRVSGLLDAPMRWSKPNIRTLYDVRSRIVHGRLEARPNSKANLRLLKKMECLSKLCIRRLISKKAFKHFASSSARDQFMASL